MLLGIKGDVKCYSGEPMCSPEQLDEEVKKQNQPKDKKRVMENELQNMEKFSYFINDFLCKCMIYYIN